MPRLPDHVIDEVRARINIVDIVSEHVKLQRSGQRYKGLCPFHSEKTPSFHVDPEKQLYHCFGCHAGGDVFRFAMDIQKAPFGEVLRALASRAGIPIDDMVDSPEEARKAKERESLYKVNEWSAEYFVRCLFTRQGERARRYLKERGLTERAVRAFRIGYAFPDWHDLEHYLKDRGVDPELAHKAGVLGKSDRGTYDWMRDRITFPIVDPQGRVVGFGGRTISGDKVKYVNSTESAIFSKRKNLYGLNVAAEALRKADRVVIVEGYMDVVGLYEKGFSPAVASLGTAFTEDQAKLIKRYASEAILAYDADTAGQAATLRGLDVLAAQGLAVRVVRLPEGEDPDSYVRNRGLEAFQNVIVDAVSLIQYKLDEAVRGIDLGSVEGRVRATRRILPVLAGIESPVAREGYTNQLAARLGVTPEALAEELDRHVGGPKNRGRHNLSRGRYTNRDLRQSAATRKGSAPRRRSDSALLQSERDLLAYVLREPEKALDVVHELGATPFSIESYNSIFRLCVEQGERRVVDEPLTRQINDPDLARTARSLLTPASGPVGPIDVYVRRVGTERLRSRVKGLERELTHLLQEDLMSPTGINRLVTEYKRLRDAVHKSGDRFKAS